MLTPGLLGLMAQACHQGEGLPEWLCTCSCLTSWFFFQGCHKQASENTWWEGARGWELGSRPIPPLSSLLPKPTAQSPTLPKAISALPPTLPGGPRTWPSTFQTQM